MFVKRGGAEVDTQGDAFFYAFERAADAVEAANDGQSALADGPLRVRIGIHTGEPLVTDEGYVGIDVHRAARIAALLTEGRLCFPRRRGTSSQEPSPCASSASTGSRI
jgi:class 3 adenylate cyclase